MSDIKQPMSLYPLSLTEMWERYGFYTIQALLLLFLLDHLRIDSTDAYIITGTFTAISYISPLIGGYIADRLIAQRMAVMLGIFFLGISYAIFSISINSLDAVYIALTGAAIGTGLLKPNLACLIGGLYKPGDKHRDSGFSIYYALMAFGITLGSFIPQWVQEHTDNWSDPFILASASMLFAFVLLMVSVFFFKVQDIRKTRFQFKNIIKALLICGITWVAFYLFFTIYTLALIAFGGLVFFSIGSLIYFAIKEVGIQRKRIFVILFLCVISAIYWMLYFQVFLSLVVFISYCVSKTFLGFNFYESYYIAVESIGLVVLGPLLGILFKRFYHKMPSVDSSIKFFLAMLTITFCFFFLYLVVSFSNQTALIKPALILFVYVSVAVSEILLSPVGLSMVTKLSPPRIVSYMMGIFYVSLGIGGYLGGWLAKIVVIPERIQDSFQGKISSSQIVVLKQTFSNAFLCYALIGFVTVLFSFILVQCLRRWMVLPEKSLVN
ncbi:peptide MFS transporter [Francisella uliginis]|uniref:Major facilitator superfamily (MFS) profile domain-containing protein n=1 Tax=Francisella uliginis TaxID=573570 RepID=A0A1L4BTD6_9GAMM|nr:oligopeptide:H+ symporter [Francisella uliginis]API87108.1 hypothetical protein F7310_06950 [Francisella uliginis]